MSEVKAHWGIQISDLIFRNVETQLSVINIYWFHIQHSLYAAENIPILPSRISSGSYKKILIYLCYWQTKSKYQTIIQVEYSVSNTQHWFVEFELQNLFIFSEMQQMFSKLME